MYFKFSKLQDWGKRSSEGLTAQSGRGFVQQNYYTGNALSAWTVQDDTVTFGKTVRQVKMSLRGEENTTVDAQKLTYTVSVEHASQLATVTMTLKTEGLEKPVVEGVNGWFVISQKEQNGTVVATLALVEGVTGEDAVDIAILTAATPAQPGEVRVVLQDAELCTYEGEGEDFARADLTDAVISTKMDYSIYDVNCDGEVNLKDITRAQRWFGQSKGAEYWNDRADVNKDGTVDVVDFILILNNYTAKETDD